MNQVHSVRLAVNVLKKNLIPRPSSCRIVPRNPRPPTTSSTNYVIRDLIGSKSISFVGNLFKLFVSSQRTPFVKSAALILSFVPLRAMAESNSNDVHSKADQLFDSDKFEDLLKYLLEQPNWSDDSELLWRVARAQFQVSKSDSKNKNQLVKEANNNVRRSLELNNECGPAHKWAAVLLDQASAIDGTRARIEQTVNVRNHMEQAIRLMPNDGTAHYLLGEWHFSVCNISWLEKKLASAIFATLPEGSLETALEMFDKGEQVEPGFYSKNLVLLAKTLAALKRDPERQKTSLLTVVEKYKDSDRWDDKEAVKEAKDLLYKLGVKV